MSHTTSEVKYESSYGESFVPYKSLFRVYRRDVSDQAFSYMTGLLKSERGKGNIERIEELEYHQYQHFISNSPWDDQAVFKQVGRDVHELMQAEQEKTGDKTGLIIDESAHLKKGKQSVGVARQYAGIIGKVDNCQVGVYASLCTGQRSCLIKERLFLGETWSEDEDRCEKAGIPESLRVHKTKLVLALEMIDESLEQGIHFDWIGGDGLYGHSTKFAQELDQRGLLFVLDIHKDFRVFTTQPQIQEVEKQQKAPEESPRLKADQPTFRVDHILKQLSDKDWEKVRIRKTCKGWLKAWIHTCEVWVWDGKEKEARKRTLIIRKSIS